MTDTPDSRPLLSIVAPLKAWGGIEQKIITLAREFMSQGVAVELVRLRGGERPYPERWPRGLRDIELPSRSKWDGVPRLAHYLRQRRPDAVLTTKDHGAQVTLLARLLPGTPRFPVFVKVTNTLSLVARRTAQRKMIRWLYPRADGIITVSQGVAEDLSQSFGIHDRVNVIYNPTITPDFKDRLKKLPEHPWFAEPRGEPVIVGVGRLAHQKDFSTLIEAFARLRADRPCRLLILGEGPQRTELESLAAKKGVSQDIDLPGYVSDPAPFMAAADLFVLSSRKEGLSNVLIEALATGTRIVSTDCPSGSAEILENGKHGTLVPVGDPESMAEAMKQRLALPRLGTDQVTQAVKRFRSDQVAIQYLECMGLAHTKQPSLSIRP